MELTTNQLLDKGVRIHNEGKVEEAERIYQSILKTDPKHPHANHNLGILLSSFNKLEKLKAALPLFKISTEVNPDNAQFWMSYGNALYATNQLKEAETSYKKSIKLRPDYADAYVNLGIIFHEFGRYDEALENYKKAIELKPDSAECFNNMAGTLKAQSNFNEAETAFKHAITINPNYVQGHYNLGILYKDLKRYKECLSQFYKVIKIDPKYPEIYHNLINVLENEAKFYHHQYLETIPMSDKLKITDRISKKIKKKELKIDKNIINALNKLSKNINELYGFTQARYEKIKTPAINNGPCGLFANEFHRQWNSRFINQVKIVFVMQKNPIGCRHVLVKLPNGDLFDGGVGVHEFYIYNKGNFELSIMEKYDLETLDKHSWGIFRDFFEIF